MDSSVSIESLSVRIRAPTRFEFVRTLADQVVVDVVEEHPLALALSVVPFVRVDLSAEELTFQVLACSVDRLLIEVALSREHLAVKPLVDVFVPAVAAVRGRDDDPLGESLAVGRLDDEPLLVRTDGRDTLVVNRFECRVLPRRSLCSLAASVPGVPCRLSAYDLGTPNQARAFRILG